MALQLWHKYLFNWIITIYCNLWVMNDLWYQMFVMILGKLKFMKLEDQSLTISTISLVLQKLAWCFVQILAIPCDVAQGSVSGPLYFILTISLIHWSECFIACNLSNVNITSHDILNVSIWCYLTGIKHIMFHNKYSAATKWGYMGMDLNWRYHIWHHILKCSSRSPV